MEDNLLVGLNEYKVLDEKNPLAYTRDITTCIVSLIHREKNTTFLHIEASKDRIDINGFIKLLKRENNNNIKNVDLFIGKYTSYGNLSIAKFILHRLNIDYKIYEVFKNNSNETSVAYNYNTKEYYMVRMNNGNPRLTKKNLN